ncbi:unnamed protein product [Protopolystoma xenopodis]|uniref:Uncharacterized protein n=1 Tax=Protopolystoma xenopodis TaxID=117903 RepID=A0A3S5FGD0_9PLAT|nr:unnamed protein product [Protopolystoma xenopodis]
MNTLNIFCLLSVSNSPPNSAAKRSFLPADATWRSSPVPADPYSDVAANGGLQLPLWPSTTVSGSFSLPPSTSFTNGISLSAVPNFGQPDPHGLSGVHSGSCYDRDLPSTPAYSASPPSLPSNLSPLLTTTSTNVSASAGLDFGICLNDASAAGSVLHMSADDELLVSSAASDELEEIKPVIRHLSCHPNDSDLKEQFAQAVTRQIDRENELEGRRIAEVEDDLCDESASDLVCIKRAASPADLPCSPSWLDICLGLATGTIAPNANTNYNTTACPSALTTSPSTSTPAIGLDRMTCTNHLSGRNTASLGLFGNRAGMLQHTTHFLSVIPAGGSTCNSGLGCLLSSLTGFCQTPTKAIGERDQLSFHLASPPAVLAAATCGSSASTHGSNVGGVGGCVCSSSAGFHQSPAGCLIVSPLTSRTAPLSLSNDFLNGRKRRASGATNIATAMGTGGEAIQLQETPNKSRNLTDRIRQRMAVNSGRLIAGSQSTRVCLFIFMLYVLCAYNVLFSRRT